MANELPLAQKWIYDKLTGDSEAAAIIGTRVYHGQAPKGAALPYVLFQHQSSFDTRGNGICRVQSNPTYQIKVVCDGNPNSDARTVANRIDQLFQEAAAETSQSYVFSSRRMSPLCYPESKTGKDGFYTHLGGLFRLAIYPAA